MSGNKGHIPQRSCVVCGNKTAKEELLRLVATPPGAVKVDLTGKLPGRGAYVCRDGVCTQGPLKRSRLEFALRMSMNEEGWASLLSSIHPPAVAT